MKTRCSLRSPAILRFIILAICVGVTSSLGRGASPDRFDRTKVQIDALLSSRLKPEPLPNQPANPFYFTGGAQSTLPASPTDPVPTDSTVLNDDQILAFSISRIRIGGQVQRGGRAHLLINSNTYKEGDLIPVRANADTVYYIKVVHIALSEVVFGYNDVIVTLPLKS